MKTSITSLLFLASSVAAHGIVTSINISGKSFKGNIPNQNAISSPIRLVTSGDPVKGATNPDVNCGHSAALASEVVNAMPGDKILIQWNGEDGVAKWPHNTGPMLTYLASCGTTPCNKFNSSNAKWFKIDQLARHPTGDKAWVQADLMTGSPANVSLPSNLASGSYIMRHEIIALHLAETIGGAEFYPSCSQINVGGNGTGKPTDDELVNLPGAYKDADPGIFYKDAFDPTAPYPFPGPAVAKFVTEGSSTSSSSQSTTTSASSTSGGSKTCTKKTSSSTSTSSTTTATVSPANAIAAGTGDGSSAGVITLIAATTAAASPSPSTSSAANTDTSSGYSYAKRDVYQPRRISRVMKKLAFKNYGRM